MTLNQRRNRMLWDRMEEQDRGPENEAGRKNELHRVIEKLEICHKNSKKNNKEQLTAYKNQMIHQKLRQKLNRIIWRPCDKLQKIPGIKRCAVYPDFTNQSRARRQQIGSRRNNETSGTEIYNGSENDRHRKNQR